MPRLRGRGAAVAALIGYGLLTLVMTYPLVRRFTSAIPGDGFDGWQNYWNLWWVRQALLVEHTHPWFTDMLYAPVGVSLLFHTLNLFNGLTTLPIQLAWGLFPAYNSAVLFSFAMSGLGAYLLARTVLGPRSSRLAAFAAGVIFTFSPFHIAHLLGHMQVISMEWVPFFALYLLRTVESANKESANQRITTNQRTSRFTHFTFTLTCHNLLLAILFLVLVALCDWYYVLYCLIFTAVVFVWVAVRAWRARRAADARDGDQPPAPTPTAPSRPHRTRDGSHLAVVGNRAQPGAHADDPRGTRRTASWSRTLKTAAATPPTWSASLCRNSSTRYGDASSLPGASRSFAPQYQSTRSSPASRCWHWR